MPRTRTGFRPTLFGWAATTLLACTVLLAGCGGGGGSPGTGTNGSSTSIAVSSTALPNGQVGQAYTATLVATGGTAPYSWSLASGALPPGLVLAATTGVISGTPTAAVANDSITVKVVDSSSPAQTQTATLKLAITTAPLAIATPSLPNGTVGTGYDTSVAATGGTAPYTWSLSSGTLPAGLALNAATGVISGTPTAAAANAAVTFSVTDSSSPAQSATAALTFTITPSAIASGLTSLPNGMVGVAYSFTLSATGGVAPYTWALSSGTLPAGLTLSAAGVLAGTPAATASHAALGFAVTDSSNPAQTMALPLTLTIAPPGLDISTTSVPNGTVGAAYSTTLAVNGGSGPYSWQVTGGTLPAGLSLAPTTGVISGTPTTAATSSVTFSVTDAETPAQSTTVTLTFAITASTLTSTLTSLPSATVGAAYSTTLTASGGTPPYTWTLATGSTLPAGLVLAANGLISGTPTTAVTTATLGFTARDSGTPAQSLSLTVTLTVAPAALGITTTALPNGSVGTAYTTTLAATGGTPPYSWSVSSGALPAGLTLAGATGVISGTPTASVTNSAIGLTVTDSGTPARQTATSLNLTIAAGASGTVTLTPTHAEVTVNQPLTLSAQTSDGSSVQWSITPAGAAFSTPTSTSGTSVTLTAPATAGRYTVSATSTSGAVGALTVAVTDLAGIYTYHDDVSRDGANTQEYALTTANVATGAFGKLFSCVADGAIYAQPLWVAGVTVSGARHNVVFVATEHDSVFAYDADTSPCVTLWGGAGISLIDAAHGGTAGETSVPYLLVGNGPTAPTTAGDIQPEIGVTGTPVIDPATNTLYVVSKSVDATQTVFYQRLHAIDITTGAEKGTPVTIAASAPGTYNGAAGTVVFNAQEELQRPALALANGYVYVAFSGHEDHAPFFGWTLAYAYNGTTGALTAATPAATLNDNPNTGYGGIWMGGSGPAVDESGYVYLMTGNGTFTGNTGGTEYGDSMLKLSAVLGITQYFTPTTYAADATNDKDLGAGGAAILADLPINGSGIAHLILGGGKDGTLYVLNRDMLGGLDSTGNPVAWQEIPFGAAIFSTGAFWNNTFFLRGANIGLKQYALNATTALFNTTAVATSTAPYGFLTNSPSVSASGTTNGIVWDLDTRMYCTHNATTCGPAVLHAFDATNVATELWNSSLNAGDAAGNAVKFTLPTIANGKVYVGTRGNNTGGAYGSTTVSGELDVYGLTH